MESPSSSTCSTAYRQATDSHLILAAREAPVSPTLAKPFAVSAIKFWVHPCFCAPGTSHIQIIQQSHWAIISALSQTKVNKDRLVYAVIGMLLTSQAPAPFGGMQNAFASLQFSTASEFLSEIVTRGFRHYWVRKDRKIIKCIVSYANKALHFQAVGLKDQLDELMMKGMKRCGHLKFQGLVMIPMRLCHADESVENERKMIEFEVRRQLTMTTPPQEARLPVPTKGRPFP
ncbi:hypothetical protein BC830DRAFT_1076690 [Chytriomyces sp. MP71]|nr:hypothetical protein BC830DRAFT_1076690 [Chytriomyces sp. MP71]